MKINKLKKSIEITEKNIDDNRRYLAYEKKLLINYFSENDWYWLGVPVLGFLAGYHVKHLLKMKPYAYKFAKLKILNIIQKSIL